MTRYLRNTLLWTLALCGAVALFNYIVDPYSIYHFESADTDRLSRVEQFYQMRISKPWQVTQIKPNAIVIGTSRSGGIHPRHPSWSGQQSFNFSVPGMTPYELLRFIEHAQANGPLDKLMIGLDFEVFINPEPHTRNGFAEFRMARDQDAVVSLRSGWQFVLDMTDTLFSIPALSRSLAAVSGTAIPGRRYYRDGSWGKTSSTFTGKSGYLFVGKKRVIRYREKVVDLQENIAILGDILRFCHQQGVDTRLFITPEHVFLVDLWFRLGYEELWREFHQALIAINSAVARDMGRQPFPLWGFNNLAGIVDEPILASANNTQRYYQDGLHFRDNLAGVIMNGAWGEPKNIGTRLNAKNLDHYVTQVLHLSNQFEKRNHTLSDELRGKMNLPAR